MRSTAVDPVLVEIVEGSLASIEKEVETAIGRTARSPMIRDAHDFRAGIHDAQAAQADRPVLLRAGAPGRPRLPARDDAPGRRVLPQRRLPVRGRHRPPARPVRHGAGVRRRAAAGPRSSRSCRRSATTTTSAARCPARCRRSATSVFEEGLMVPPIKLWDQGVPNEAALRIMTRNSRMPDSLAADLDAECSACLMGVAPAGRAVRPLRPRDGRGLLRRDHRQDDRDLPARDPVEDPGRRATSGRTTPSTTASTSRGCTPSASR